MIGGKNQSSMAYVEDVPENGTGSDVEDIADATLRAAETLLFWRSRFLIVICLLIIVGNVMVIACVVKFQWLRCPGNYLVVSLSSSDLFVGGVFLPLTILAQISTNELRPDWLCHVIAHIEPTLCFLTILHILAINVERFVCLQFPLRYHQWMTSRVMSFMVTIPWIMAAVDTVITHLTMEIQFTPYCVFYPPSEAPRILAVMVFLVPFVTICIIYARIWQIVRHHFEFAREQAHAGMCHNESRCTCIKANPTQHFHIKITRTVAMVLGTFGCSWGIYTTAVVVYGSVDDAGKETIVCYVIPIAEILLFLKSATNPWIYAFWCPQFKKAFVQMMTLLRGKRQPSCTIVGASLRQHESRI